MKLRGIVAKNLRRLRTERQVTQEELADRAGLNRKYPSLLENEHYAASVDVLEKLATALDVDPVEFFRRHN
ncbi:transcriptional regulator with XRE-family HTH domain [Phenylobacterium haematophilum]|uniref:Transcriptional regulator with XRE-family HTH domain n=1 Tax=Phenylobacterium haematophilum TaxID=98513 RepID=A0A839ZXX2_9CAUL|nr:helix-turn-helix transcriptional regulator [Phenylobacterium haematophilum]MBB3890579.1 transcriptional regulator with XRE-family HTH domain [Phenylobacterium haematophilum]